MKFTILLLLLSLELLSKTLNIALLMWSNSIEGQVLMRDGIINEAKHINQNENIFDINLTILEAGDGENGMERQREQVSSLIKKDVIDLFIIQPTDGAVLIDEIKEINRKKIPIVTYDGYILNIESNAHLTSDNYALGFLNGEYVANSFDKEDINIVIISYPNVPQTRERVEGFLDALNSFNQKYKIIKEYKAVEPKMGEKVAKELLKDFPKKGSIDVIFAINDAGAYPIVVALDKENRDEIFFASIDGDPRMIEYIKKDRIVKIDSAQFCKILGKETMKLSYNILTNKDRSRYVKLPVFPVTKETLKLFKGWDSDIPKSFKKPWKSKKSIWSNSLTFSK